MAQPQITTRDQLIGHIFNLMDDHDAVGDLWRSQNIYTFLQFMASWLNSAGEHYNNVGQDIDVEKPSWQLFADALSAASVYE
jgi:hypothetical protein